jgi:hypothetical protein
MSKSKKKKTGAAKTAPKGDTTQKRRQSRRREKLNKIAKASGFASWSVYETACLNGAAKPEGWGELPTVANQSESESPA